MPSEDSLYLSLTNLPPCLLPRVLARVSSSPFFGFDLARPPAISPRAAETHADGFGTVMRRGDGFGLSFLNAACSFNINAHRHGNREHSSHRIELWLCK
ncbi:hypothetical protein SKAU_G00202770 [Synaphobranchus kaupii]|uniref:Uncharacterized protein n=1 Tax=Synaphobranchus kaupii TaxID=118154 RepID=A0A9Q1FFT8_SYNKA|nr:hypothetical protein SKAU_G00202770 [Synaphobranchus kaupii]